MFRWLSRNRNKQVKAKPIEIDAQGDIYSVAFLPDGKHIVSGGNEKKVRRWRATDGKENGVPMDVGSWIYSIAVSRDSKWIVTGTNSGKVTVWEEESNKKTMELHGYSDTVLAVDISPGQARIATGSNDRTVCLWSLAGERLLDPWRHDHWASAAKFSPDALLIATATWNRESIRVYDSQNGNLLVDYAIRVESYLNETLAWSSNKHLFALSRDGNINHLDVSTGTILSRWPIHGFSDPYCIALATNSLFIAASNDSSVSFWDITTLAHKQTGAVVHHTTTIMSMAISGNFNLAMAGGNKITLHSLRDILPSHYFDI